MDRIPKQSVLVGVSLKVHKQCATAIYSVCVEVNLNPQKFIKWPDYELFFIKSQAYQLSERLRKKLISNNHLPQFKIKITAADALLLSQLEAGGLLYSTYINNVLHQFHKHAV